MRNRWSCSPRCEFETIGTCRSGVLEIVAVPGGFSEISLRRLSPTYFVNDTLFRVQTGLTGKYDVRLKWSVEGQMVNGEPVEGDTAPSMFTAVKETLGLELKPTHGPVQVLVVAAAEEPTANREACTA